MTFLVEQLIMFCGFIFFMDGSYKLGGALYLAGLVSLAFPWA